jgi:FkbM family methyltransferase
MIFYNEKGAIIDHLHIERPEQLLAEKYIPSDAVVLELGARYGTVSAVISKKLSNPLHFVAVEPDERVWNALEKNMKNNGCTFNLIKGVISLSPLILTEIDSHQGYGITSVKAESSTIKSYTLKEVERMYNLKFDTLMADCEGFLEIFMDENPILYNQLKLIIFEQDYGNKCNYEKIKTMLANNGFTCIVTGFHQVWKRM